MRLGKYVIAHSFFMLFVLLVHLVGGLEGMHLTIEIEQLRRTFELSLLALLYVSLTTITLN
jgi:hypothetical protein